VPATELKSTKRDRSAVLVSACRWQAASSFARSTGATRSGPSGGEHDIIEHARGVEDGAERVLGRDRGKCRFEVLCAADVTGSDGDLCAELLELGDERAGTACVESAA